MEYIPAKTIVTRTKSTAWFGAEYNMNIYRGCSHGCIYCDSRSGCYGIDNFDEVRVKENALAIIRNDLRRKVKTGVVATGAMSDPYNPLEEDLKLTRHSLELINAYGFGIAIATKSPLVIRDIDVLSDIKEQSPVIVKMTITTVDDAICKKIEPNVSVTSERFRTIKELSKHNIYCGVLLMPLLPFINDTKKNIIEIVNLARENGARFIYPSFGVTLRANQRNYFYKKLDEFFPELKSVYIRQYGNRYSCGSLNGKALYELFSGECDRLGLLYKMKDIIRSYKLGYGHQQISLF